jgi:hypothetical protein
VCRRIDAPLATAVEAGLAALENAWMSMCFIQGCDVVVVVEIEGSWTGVYDYGGW